MTRVATVEGSLALDAPEERHLGGFPRGPEGGIPTVRHLLEHRSGIPHRVPDAIDETQTLRPIDIVGRVRSRGLLFEPGSRRLYSSAGYTCLARVIELVEQGPFEATLTRRVFGPAGMISARSETGQQLMPDRAVPHRLSATDGTLAAARAPCRDLRFLTGAGSVYATAADLPKLARATRAGVFGDGLRERIQGGPPEEWRGVTGRTNGYEASVDIRPRGDLTFVFLGNLQSAANWQIRERVRDVLLGRPVDVVPLAPPVVRSPDDPGSLVGRYGPAVISLVDGHLFRGENGFYPIDGGRYYIPASRSVMRFRRDSSGAVDAIVSIGGDGEERVLARSP